MTLGWRSCDADECLRMSFSEVVEDKNLRAPWAEMIGRVFDVVLAAAMAGVVFLVGGSERGSIALLRTGTVFVIAVVGLVWYHRLIERRMEARLGASATQELRAAKDRFIANISHGLRTPLTGIVGFAHLLASSVKNPEEVEAARMILGESAELGRIVDDLVVAARMDADSLTVLLEDASFAEQLDPVLAYMDLIGAPVAVDCTDARVRIDPELFRQVLRNLLANAHRHGRPQVKIRGWVARGRLVCHVVDQGPGVPSELRDKLFSRFTQQTRGGVTGHVGLGLAVVQELCSRMGVQVGYRRVGGQTHFVLSIPLAAEQEDPSGRVSIEPERVIRVGDRLLRVPA